MIPAPIRILSRHDFLEADLAQTSHVISICEFDEEGTVLRDDFAGERLNLYFYDLPDGHGVATQKDVLKAIHFSARWAREAHDDPANALVVHCFAGISRSSAIAMVALLEYYGSLRMATGRLFEANPYAQPNTLVLHLISELLELKENIYEVMFRVQSGSIMLF